MKTFQKIEWPNRYSIEEEVLKTQTDFVKFIICHTMIVEWCMVELLFISYLSTVFHVLV